MSLTQNIVSISVNLARGKTTSQSSTFAPQFYPSSNAVNGQTDCSKYAHTLFGKYEWWQVDLEDVYEIKKIQIYYRPECKFSFEYGVFEYLIIFRIVLMDNVYRYMGGIALLG